jgi:hypothetical protein
METVQIVTERRTVDACGSPIWVHDGNWDEPSTTALTYFILQSSAVCPEWLRVWYNRQRDLPLAPPR